MAEDAPPAASVSKFTGLYRSVDPVSIPPGAMQRAENIVVPGPSLLRPRRGFAPGTTDAFSAAEPHINELSFYGDTIVATTTTPTDPPSYASVNATSKVAIHVFREASTFDLSAGTLAAYGFTTPAQTQKRRFFTANGDLYLTANFGLARTAKPPALTGAVGWDPAGMDTPLAGGFTLDAGGNFLANGSQCAYRFTYRFTDANNIEHRGPPSSKVVVSNTAGASRGVFVKAAPSSMVLPGTVIETWRTETVPIPSDGSDGTGDECFKIDERPVAGVNIGTGADGYLTVTGGAPGTVYFCAFSDNTPNVPFLVEPLYTNPTTGEVNGLGIANANTPPPAAADVFTFKSRTYFCNTQEVERLTTQIIGTGAGGIVNGDTMVLGGTTFVANDGSGSIFGSGLVSYDLYRSGGFFDAGSIVENIRKTAASLALNINGVLGPQHVFLYGLPNLPLSQQIIAETAIVSGLPGYVALRRLAPGLPSFSIAAGVGGGRGWAGSLATNNVSDSNRQPANLMQSQPDDPESVPPALTNTVGRLDRPILRGIGLRDSAFVFKGQGDGLWKFTDDGTGSLVIGPLDQTVNCVAPETVVSLENAVFAFCDKGVLSITDGGAPENVSDNKVQDDLDRLLEYVGRDTLARVAFAVAYESEHLYILCLPEAPNATTCTVQFVYNTQTGAWSRWTLPALTAGGVSPFNDTLVFGRDASLDTRNPMWIERKALDDSDQQDPGFTGVVPGAGTYAASALVFSGDLTASYAPGDLIRYSPDVNTSYLLRVTSVVWAVGSNQTTVTLNASATWTAGGSFDVLKGIQCRPEFLPLVAGDPLYEKQWQDVYLYFRRTTFASCDTSFATEKQQTHVVYPLAGPTAAPYLWSEALGFGLEPWGGPARDVILHQPLDQAAARGAELTLGFRFGDALASWELSALRIPYVPTTRRVSR